ncbi:LysR family transcriptional regulator [Paraburkholderia agricolaris]|uniref:LysR family transcriptional regulator n=1 Tax=Paraburkholderia agricolaris TaxID=2152888 RepID=UPI0012917F44|nr:LysR family transcriptional regulator [Paraburkholderia agricolaris]
MLDLNEIYLFVEVVQAGSFAEAARRLGMPPNTISRHVLQLEAELKSRLFVRTTRKLTLTAIGQTFYEQCARNIRELVVAGQQVADTHPEPMGPLRVAVFADFFDIFPISWITEFLARYPGVTLEFVVDNAYLDLMASGVDLALRPESMLDENSTRRVLCTSRGQLVASPKYLETRGTPANLDELGRYDCLLISRNSGPGTWHLNGPDGRRRVQVQGRFLASTSNPVRQAAVDGLGIALLFDLYAKRDLAAGRLVPVLDRYRSDPSNFCAVFPNHRHIRRVATIFVDAVQSKLVEMYSE